MEKIKILKTELTSLGFNINIFVDNLLHISESFPDLQFNETEAWGSAEAFQVIIRDRQLFTFEAKDIFIIRQLLATGYFLVDQTQDESSNTNANENMNVAVVRSVNAPIESDIIKIRLDRIALGTHHNIPANKDIVVKKIASSPYYGFAIPELSDSNLKLLLRKAELLYDIGLARSYVDSRVTSSIGSYNYEKQNVVASLNPYNIGILNKYFRKELFYEPTKSFRVFISQLTNAGLLEILRELINKQEDKIAKFISQNESIKRATKIKSKIHERLYQKSNLYNRLVNTMKKSAKSYESILDKIETLDVSDVDSLMSVISKADRGKLEQLIKVGLPEINNCSHNNVFQRFYTSRNKEDKYKYLDQIRAEYVRHDETDHVYRCKKCDQFLYCEHTIEFDNAATIGLTIPYEIKNKLADKYRNPMVSDINGTIFCQYCGEKIHRYQNDELMDENAFNAISHARSADDGLTELPIVKNESFIAIRKVLDSFIFKYDINRIALIKDIQNIILHHILSDLVALRVKLEDEHFNAYAQLISAIYTFIYMMDIYIRDPNVIMKDTRGGAKLNINEYAGEFASRISQLYRYVTTDQERISKMIKNAYITMKNEMRSDLNVITDKDIAMYIINNPYYEFLYYLFSIEKSKEGKSYSMVDAFHHIIKADITKEFFLVRAYAPTSALWKSGIYKALADTYNMNINFASPYNDCQIKSDIVGDLSYLPNYESMEYDPSLLNERHKMIEERTYQARRLRYLDLLFRNEKREPFSIIPACYVYDDSLKQYNWQPLIENKKAIDYTSGDSKLSKLKCDDAKSNSIMSKLAVDKRTKALGKHVEKSAKKAAKEVELQRDIQFSIVRKISQSINVNQLKFIGQSGGVTFAEFNKGNVLVPIQYELCSLKLESYVKYFVRMYNTLRYNANRSDNLKYFEQANMLGKISKYTPEFFPDIKASEVLSSLSPNIKNRYVQLQEYLVNIIATMLKTEDPILRLFVIETVTTILNIDKTYCINDTFIAASSDAAIDDEDAIGNNDQADEVNEDDEGFIDADNIDYEENEDEEHDPSD